MGATILGQPVGRAVCSGGGIGRTRVADRRRRRAGRRVIGSRVTGRRTGQRAVVLPVNVGGVGVVVDGLHGVVVARLFLLDLVEHDALVDLVLRRAELPRIVFVETVGQSRRYDCNRHKSRSKPPYQRSDHGFAATT